MFSQLGQLLKQAVFSYGSKIFYLKAHPITARYCHPRNQTRMSWKLFSSVNTEWACTHSQNGRVPILLYRWLRQYTCIECFFEVILYETVCFSLYRNVSCQTTFFKDLVQFRMNYNTWKCLLYDVFNFLFRFALFPALFTNMLQIVCTVCDVQELLQTA